ncbi:MAG: YceI family protein [Labilithrix sp.]|nr:YceI family protein [Labilithrix sp.]MCW5836854.1 YceI family protein [Labilithrix sp.]
MIAKNARFLFALAAGATLTVAAVAHAKLSRVGPAEVQFTASGPAGMSIVGTSNDLQITETDKEIIVTVPLAKLDTKIELRNKHMREKYLEVAKYPNAELRVSKDGVQKNATSSKANGTLTLHGTTKPTSFTYTSKPDGSVSGAVHVNMKDFGIAQPGYAGVSVKPDVDVTVAFRVAGE